MGGLVGLTLLIGLLTAAEAMAADDPAFTREEGRQKAAGTSGGGIDGTSGDKPEGEGIVLLFRLAMAAMDAGDYDQAASLLELMLASGSRSPRVMLELARASYELGRDRVARRWFRRVLSGGPPRGVRARIVGYLDRIAARAPLRPWLDTGPVIDSNLNSAPPNARVTLFSLPFVLAPANRRRSGIGWSLNTGVSLLHPSGPEHPAPTRFRGSLGVSWLEYPGFSDDNLTLSAALGPEGERGRLHWIVRPHLSLHIAAGRLIDVYNGFEGEVGVALDRANRYRIFFSTGVTQRSGVDDSRRNGPAFQLQSGLRWRAPHDVTVVPRLIGRYVSAPDVRLAHRALGGQLDVQWRISPLTTLAAAAGGSVRQDLAAHPAYSARRLDRSGFISLSLGFAAPSALGFLRPTLSVSYSLVRSNLDLYSWQRFRGGLSFTLDL